MGLISLIRNALHRNSAQETGPEKTVIEPPNDEIKLISSGDKRIPYKCGHDGPENFVISIYGTRSKVIKDRDRCPDCVMSLMKKIIIRCALCGHSIFPGQPVAVYHESSKLPYKKVGHRVRDSYIGCLAMDCCPSGGFFAGYWNGEELEFAFSEGETVINQVFKTGKGIVCSDVNDPKSIRTLDIAD